MTLDRVAVPEPRQLDARVGGAPRFVVDVLGCRVEEALGAAFGRAQLGCADLAVPWKRCTMRFAGCAGDE